MASAGTPPTHAYTELRRKDAATVEVRLRHSEMHSISERLGRCGEFPWTRMWTSASTLLGGAVIGGVLGLIPFLSTKPGPSNWDRLLYFGLLIVGGILALVFAVAAWTTHSERTDSIKGIREDFDKYLLGSFEELVEADPPVAS